MKPRQSLSSRVLQGALALVTAASLVGATGCSSNHPQQGYNNGGQWGGPNAMGGPQQQGNGSPGLAAVMQQNLPPVMNDPINNTDFPWMRQRAGVILAELVAALGPQQRAKVEGIPLVSENDGEVNAYAGCQNGSSFMATTDGLLEVVAFSARSKATDEVFGTRKLDAYVSMVAQGAGSGGGLQRPQPGFYDPSQDVDGRKVLRQNNLFDAQLAFVLGHELGHHYLGHTGCANGANAGSGITLGDLGRVISNRIPVMNQPNEATADQAGTYNLLAVGTRRPQGQQFNEEGAMLVLNFFVALHNAAGVGNSILAVFDSTHPSPSIRIPLVQNAANTWRQTGGNPPPVFSY